MLARNAPNQIRLPKPCQTAGGLGSFSREVITALAALRDRRVIYDSPSFRSLPIRHEWKTTFGGDGTNPDEYIWRYIGGDVITQGGTVTVADGEVEGGAGFLVLKIVRDETSREILAAPNGAIVEFSSTVPVSDYAYQYVVLAILSPETEGVPPVLQLQFERLLIHEMMLVTNGEFDLAQFRMASNNIYDLPP